MRLIVGYLYGSVWYCMEHVPDPDVGEVIDLGELPSPPPQCSVCGKSLDDAS